MEDDKLYYQYLVVEDDYISCVIINPLPDDKIFDWSKLKQIADDILKWI